MDDEGREKSGISPNLEKLVLEVGYDILVQFSEKSPLTWKETKQWFFKFLNFRRMTSHLC